MCISNESIESWFTDYITDHGSIASGEDLYELALYLSDDKPIGDKASVILSDWLMSIYWRYCKSIKDSKDENENACSEDLVNHPAHYTAGGIECIDAIKASMSSEGFEGYLKGNVLKYLWRYRNKNAPEQDLKKAEWYQHRLIDHVVNTITFEMV